MNTNTSLRDSAIAITEVATVALPGPVINNETSTTSGLAKNPKDVIISELPIVPSAPADNE